MVLLPPWEMEVPHKYVYQRFPSIRESEVDPQMITTVYSVCYPSFGTRKKRTVFWWAKIKTHAFSTNVKIDPQEYVYMGSPSLYYQQKLQKHRTNSVLMGENYNTNFVEIRQNGPSEYVYYGFALPLLSTKTPKIKNELCFYGCILQRELCRSTSK